MNAAGLLAAGLLLALAAWIALLARGDQRRARRAARARHPGAPLSHVRLLDQEGDE